MFELLIIKPIFNLLVFIYAILPGHNFGLALIIFTIVVRLLMWPLVKKQLHHATAMRKLQPEIKRIKQATKGDRQQESLLLMQLYKEREISPFGSLGVLIVQMIIIIGLYQGLIRVINDPQTIITLAYGWLSNLSFMKELAGDIGQIDLTLFGFIDLSRSAIGEQGFYLPAFLLVTGSAVTQYYQSKQLMPSNENSRSLRQILREAGTGKQADQSEVQAATGQAMRYFIPVFIFIFTIGLASALALYWFVSGLVAFVQQRKVLNQDEQEMEAIADKPDKGEVIEGEVIQKKPSKKPSKKPGKKTAKKKRRK